MPESPPARIHLSLSKHSGIVAIALGEQYRWAQTALTSTGFHRRDDGSYVLPNIEADTVRSTVNDLLAVAERHQTTLTTGSRPFLGDVAEAIAGYLPGVWRARLEIYSNPVWQSDLLSCLWGSDEIAAGVVRLQVPYAAVLYDDAGTELLLIERPGHPDGYLVGALEPKGFRHSVGDQHLPSLPLPAQPARAAHMITDSYLPTYRSALHHRRIAAVVEALSQIRQAHDWVQAIVDTGRLTDGTVMPQEAIMAFTNELAKTEWFHFRGILTHAPPLLLQCTPELVVDPDDSAALNRLEEALTLGRDVAEEWSAQPADRRTIPAAVMPAVATWLADGEVFLRRARAAAPRGVLKALPSSAPKTVSSAETTMGSSGQRR